MLVFDDAVMHMTRVKRRGANKRESRLTSEKLATLIIDALVSASIVRIDKFAEAVAIATQEIDARKALGDY